MKTLEFSAAVRPDRTLMVPTEIATQVPTDRPVRVVLLVSDDEERDWNALTAEQFLAGYAAGDAIYDQLPPR